MVKNHIVDIIKGNLNYLPTPDQLKLMEQLAEFVWEFSNPKAVQDSVFIVKGYAGTGKTTIISSLVKSLPSLKMKSVLLAPTGRAAKVLSGYSEKTASTIHKKIYRQKTIKDGIGEFQLDNNLHKNTVFIVDEASMISNGVGENSIFGSGRLLDDLFEYVYGGGNCKIILVGDTAQLPPVHLAVSPALDAKVIDSMGFEVHECVLSNVVRQSKESGILFNATTIRNQITEGKEGYPILDLEPFKDIRRIAGNELIEEIENCYSEFGMDNTIVVCRSNKRANKYNEGIRRTILWHEDELCIGDFLMIVKNNYYWLAENETDVTDFIANGDIVEIMRIGKYKELYGFRFANVTLRFMDYPDLEIEANINLDTLALETASLSGEQNNKLFFTVLEDYAMLRTKKAKIKAVKENPYFNALQIKFSYAITCHKAQGGQWKAVFVDQGWLKEDMLNIEYLRWLYTAFTRPIERLYLVNFNDDFFADNER